MNGTRCGFVALVGAPNAGKSTLLNLMVGGKVSIVTPKVQTTRSRITGICMAGDRTQIIFLDTPGIFKPKRRLERAMVSAAWSGAHDADLVVVLVDVKRGFDGDTRRIIEGLTQRKRHAVLALNKIDGARRDDLLPLAAKLNESGVFSDSFMISALTGDGVDDLRDFLAGRYSIADMACWRWAWGWERLGQDIEEFPNLKVWLERVGNRPGVRRGNAVGADLRPANYNLGDDPEAKKILFGQRA